ncbi:GNAT family N-acetyltransferase [Heliobacterium gestii]|uniref:GNAT family N-acetyltransferase n=1 Tax=Heliomicrobium gestii TaxID=2699 RepID=A0A845LBP8_HELGE|nr:GNAT family N-acetyltransferase [Heliomicrobium gestii]MBM7867331.1 putative GNAT family N-acyltransferase [Heliomicrobium gestii]MZP43598.1 GNAT family N-acetyltransferase [Heliomicrobium gestii]
MAVYEVIDKLTGKQIEEAYHLCKQEWWGKERKLDEFQKAVHHSSVVLAFREVETEKIIAFARVITDFTYKAMLIDIVVAEHYRKNGLGREMMERIVHHPELESVSIFELFCAPELTPFYEKWGFVERLGKVTCMRRRLEQKI